MIPDSWLFTVRCDKCGSSKRILLRTEDIDAISLDGALSDNLEEDGWEIMYPNTICPACVKKILAHALADLALTLDTARLNQTAPTPGDVEAAGGSA